MASEPTASSFLFFRSCLTALSSPDLGRKETKLKLVSGFIFLFGCRGRQVSLTPPGLAA